MRVHYSRPVAGLSAIRSQTFQQLSGEYEGRLLRTGYHHQVARLHLQSIAHFGVWIEQRPDGLVRITLKRAYADGTVAVDMDPLSLLCRLATSVPPPRFHTVRYAGVLAPASQWRSRIAPGAPPEAPAGSDEPGTPERAGGYRPWAELLARTFAVDVLACPSCQGRMRLLAMVKEPASIARYLAAVGEPTEVPRCSPGRGPPYWKSRVLRRRVLGDEDG